MTIDLQLSDQHAPETSAPTVFSRIFSIPAGLPWEQRQAAELEARLGAPLPASEILHQVRRLDRWRPSRPGKFGAFYARKKDVRDRLLTEVVVNGAAVRLEFLSAAARARFSTFRLVAVAVCGVSLAVLLLAIVAALNARTDLNDRLSHDETLADTRQRQAQKFGASQALGRLLDSRDLAGHDLRQALSDLAVLAREKAPGVEVRRLRWERGFILLEIHGDGPTLRATTRRMMRGHKPLANGDWVWAIAPEPPITTGAPNRTRAR